MVDAFQIVGFVALMASSFGFLPQVVKTFRTKKAEDISLYTLILLITASSSWTAYGLSKSDFFIILTNVIIFVLVLVLTLMKLSYRNHHLEDGKS